MQQASGPIHACRYSFRVFDMQNPRHCCILIVVQLRHANLIPSHVPELAPQRQLHCMSILQWPIFAWDHATTMPDLVNPHIMCKLYIHCSVSISSPLKEHALSWIRINSKQPAHSDNTARACVPSFCCSWGNCTCPHSKLFPVFPRGYWPSHDYQTEVGKRTS